VKKQATTTKKTTAAKKTTTKKAETTKKAKTAQKAKKPAAREPRKKAEKAEKAEKAPSRNRTPRKARGWSEASKDALAKAAKRYDATRSCGDDVAGALRQLCDQRAAEAIGQYRRDCEAKGEEATPAGDKAVAAVAVQQALVEVGQANGIDVLGRWGARNAGMQRMNLGNCLRGRAKHGLGVVIGDVLAISAAA
jgi:hypothetical protein